MSIDKVINNGINIVSQSIQKQGQKAAQVATDAIASAKLTGLDALAAYNSHTAKLASVESILSKEQLEKINKFWKSYGSGELDNKTLNFLINALDINKNSIKVSVDKEADLYELIEFISNKTHEEREKIFNSKFLRFAFDTSKNWEFKASCPFISTEELERLDELVDVKLIRSFLAGIIEENDKKSSQIANDTLLYLSNLLGEYESRISKIESFLKNKNADKFYNLLSQRNYQDIPEISTLLQSELQGLSDKEVNEFYSFIETLLNARTPTGDFIFGSSNASDRAKKMFLDGIENILNLKKADTCEYQKLLNLLELTKQGKVPPSVLGILPKEGKINEEFLSHIFKMQDGIPFVSKFENQSEALNKSALGDVVEIGQDLFYRTDVGLDKLNLSKETFEELFPPIETFALGQGQLGDCYLVSAIFDFIKNPKARGKLYQMFSSKGDDIIVTIPDAKEFPITFSKKLLKKDGEKNINASLGVQMLEDAYRQTRALKYGTANKMTMIEGGKQANVYRAFLDKKNVLFYTSDENCKKETEKELQNLLIYRRCDIDYYKERYKGISKKPNMTSTEKFEYLRDQEYLKKINKAEAQERSLLESLSNLGNTNNVIEDDLLKKLIEFANNKNYLVSIGTKQGGIFDINKLICGEHAYSVLGADTVNKTVNVVNPWNTTQYTTLSFDEFKKYFNAIQAAEI